MKTRKIIYVFIAVTVLLNLICWRTENYTNYSDENGSTDYSVSVTDYVRVTVKYLHDSKEDYDRYVIKNLRGNLITQIEITRCVPDNKENFVIKITDCHVEILDDLNKLISYKSIEIENYEYLKQDNTISYLNEDQYLNSKPEMTEDDIATYKIHYTYPYHYLKNKKNVIFKIYLKISAEGKEYTVQTYQKLHRDDDRKYWIWFFGID